jgi:adenosylcobinamide kinase / adenosylcobinamide-phosphate guanylyltransferase
LGAAVNAHELILGGVRSGKSRTAEARAAAWLQTPGHDACLISTGTEGDDEMRERIARHRADRALRVPALRTVEAALALAEAVREQSHAQRLLVVDCLTLWLTNLLMPQHGAGLDDAACQQRAHALLAALRDAPGPVVLVSNEIGLGVMPLGHETRRFVDALGALHQQVAALCERVTLMVAGQALAVKPSGAVA